MFSRILSFLGTLKSRNEDITSDALRIAALEAANKALKKDLARAISNCNIWKAKYEGAEESLRAARHSIANLEALENENWPFVVAGLKRKAADAKYRAKRGRA